jgi:hypothetical protein
MPSIFRTSTAQLAAAMDGLAAEPVIYTKVETGSKTVRMVPAGPRRFGTSANEPMIVGVAEREWICQADLLDRLPALDDTITDEQGRVWQVGGETPWRWTDNSCSRVRVHTLLSSIPA